MKRVKYFIVLIMILGSFINASNYSAKGTYLAWYNFKKPKKRDFMSHKHYKDLDHLYIKYSKKWNTRWQTPRNAKYRGIYTSPYLLKALAWQESRWTPRINNKGVNTNRSVDYGLMQVNNRTDKRFFTASGVKATELMNPNKNIKIAMHIFNYHARAGIRNGFNNPKDKMIYWLNSYNGKRTNNPHAYGQAIVYMANMLKNLGSIDGTNIAQHQDEYEEEIDTTSYNTEYDKVENKSKETKGLLECTFPWKAPFNPNCNK